MTMLQLIPKRAALLLIVFLTSLIRGGEGYSVSLVRPNDFDDESGNEVYADYLEDHDDEDEPDEPYDDDLEDSQEDFDLEVSEDEETEGDDDDSHDDDDRDSAMGDQSHQYTKKALRHRARYRRGEKENSRGSRAGRELKGKGKGKGKGGSSGRYYSRSFLDPDIEPKPFINCIPLPPDFSRSRNSKRGMGGSKGKGGKGKGKGRRYNRRHRSKSRRYLKQRDLKRRSRGKGGGKGRSSRSRGGMNGMMGGGGGGMNGMNGMNGGRGRVMRLPYCPIPTFPPTLFPSQTPIPTFTPLPTITPFPSFTPFPTAETTNLPTGGPSKSPTIAPSVSSRPSSFPTVSNQPSVSTMPSNSPTTAAPTSSTSAPTPSPATTQAPTPTTATTSAPTPTGATNAPTPTAATNAPTASGPTTLFMESRLGYAFFPAQTPRQPTTEELNGLVVETNRFYDMLLQAQYPNNYVAGSASMVNIVETFDATGTYPVIIDFDLSGQFTSPVPTVADVFAVMEAGDYMAYIEMYVWNAAPGQSGLFFETNMVIFRARGGAVG